MKKITLSDHVGDQIHSAINNRKEEYEKQLQDYYIAEAQYKYLKACRRDRLLQAFKKGQVISIITGLFAVALNAFASIPRMPVYREYTKDNEQIWRSGEQGERMVEQYFQYYLDDDWTMLSGYHNPRGEIDLILVGPNGVFAVEVKNITGTIHCEGDQWWRDRYDRYGNLVRQGESISDRGGRSPSRQINESADRLLSQLAKRVGVERIYRIVMLTHENVRIGSMKNLTVDLVSKIPGSHPDNRVLDISSHLIKPEMIANVVKTIEKDHAYHRQSRKRGHNK